MTRPEQKHFALAKDKITGLAVTDDGARLFAVTQWTVDMFDTFTGAHTPLVHKSSKAEVDFRAGAVTSDSLTSGRFSEAIGCVIDRTTRSLPICEHAQHAIVRLRGVDV